ncbi:MAG: serine/threonine-protein phosphatase, partial [Opitutae bacterium]|nr:serine/threonine-protein phosphatase [Opitutae bacterium]
HEPGDTYLLCTDGVIEGLWDRGLMRQIISPLPNDERNPAERIVLEAVAEDGRDNATAVVLQIG